MMCEEKKKKEWICRRGMSRFVTFMGEFTEFASQVLDYIVSSFPEQI